MGENKRWRLGDNVMKRVRGKGEVWLRDDDQCEDVEASISI